MENKVYNSVYLKNIKINAEKEEYKEIYEQIKNKTILPNQFLVEVDVEQEYNNLMLKNFNEKKMEKELFNITLLKLNKILKEKKLPNKKAKNGWADNSNKKMFFIVQ